MTTTVDQASAALAEARELVQADGGDLVVDSVDGVTIRADRVVEGAPRVMPRVSCCPPRSRASRAVNFPLPV